MPSEYGIKVSNTGDDVFSTADKNLAYSSDYGRLKIYKMGTATYPGVSDSVTIAHNLGYAPAFLVFVDRDPDFFPLGGPNTLTGDDEAHVSIFAYTDSTNLVIQTIEDAWGKSTDRTFRYYILIDPAQEFTGDSNTETTSIDHGFKVSRPGIDAETAQEYQLFDSSRYKSIQYFSESIKTQSMTLPLMNSSLQNQDLEEYTWVDFNHGLGYPPLFLCWVNFGDGIYFQIPYAEFTNTTDINDNSVTYTSLEVSAKCDSTKIRVYYRRRSVWDWNLFTPSVTFAEQTITVYVVPFTERIDGYSWEG